MKKQIEALEKVLAEIQQEENQTVHLANAATQVTAALASVATHVKKTAAPKNPPAQSTPAT